MLILEGTRNGKIQQQLEEKKKEKELKGGRPH